MHGPSYGRMSRNQQVPTREALIKISLLPVKTDVLETFLSGDSGRPSKTKWGKMRDCCNQTDSVSKRSAAD